jgi:hypothetical protein
MTSSPTNHIRVLLARAKKGNPYVLVVPTQMLSPPVLSSLALKTPNLLAAATGSPIKVVNKTRKIFIQVIP